MAFQAISVTEASATRIRMTLGTMGAWGGHGRRWTRHRISQNLGYAGVVNIGPPDGVIADHEPSQPFAASAARIDRHQTGGMAGGIESQFWHAASPLTLGSWRAAI